jgi:hypothetical protein
MRAQTQIVVIKPRRKERERSRATSETLFIAVKTLAEALAIPFEPGDDAFGEERRDHGGLLAAAHSYAGSESSLVSVVEKVVGPKVDPEAVSRYPELESWSTWKGPNRLCNVDRPFCALENTIVKSFEATHRPLEFPSLVAKIEQLQVKSLGSAVKGHRESDVDPACPRADTTLLSRKSAVHGDEHLHSA